jgi:hypothetical protein
MVRETPRERGAGACFRSRGSSGRTRREPRCAEGVAQSQFGNAAAPPRKCTREQPCAPISRRTACTRRMRWRFSEHTLRTEPGSSRGVMRQPPRNAGCTPVLESGGSQPAGSQPRVQNAYISASTRGFQTFSAGKPGRITGLSNPPAPSGILRSRPQITLVKRGSRVRIPPSAWLSSAVFSLVPDRVGGPCVQTRTSVAGTLDARMWIEEASVSHPPDKTAAADEFR